MTFEQWWATEAYKGPWTDLDKVCRAAWDAATYAASTRAGDAANEAEKDARRKVAVAKILPLLEENQLSGDADRLDAIIKVAQG